MHDSPSPAPQQPTPTPTPAQILAYLNEKACCYGQDCNCRGITRLQQFVYEEGADQRDEIGSLERQRDALQAWKDSALLVEKEWDCQEVGRLLGLPLGSSVRAGIAPAIIALQAKLDAARQHVFDYDYVASTRDKLQEDLAASIAKHYETYKQLQAVQSSLTTLQAQLAGAARNASMTTAINSDGSTFIVNGDKVAALPPPRTEEKQQ